MRSQASNFVMRKSAAALRSMRGFSLVELMVAIALSLLLLTGVVAIFASSRVAYESTDQLSRVQETGRFALEELSRQIRTAGFSGCSRQPNYVSTALVQSGELLWNFAGGAVRGFEASGAGAWTPTLPAVIDASSDGNDILVIRGPRTDAAPARVTTDMPTPQAPVIVAGGSPIAVGDVVMAYSCEGASFFQVTGLTGGLQHAEVTTSSDTASFLSPGNSFDTTNFPFRRNAEVVPVETIVYSVRPSLSSIAGTAPATTTSLWRHRSGRADAEEVVEGVERMQVEYGIDDNGDRVVDNYGPATATTNWDRVISVRIALLVRSVQQYGTDTDQRTYQLFNATVTAPADRRTRQVFTTTVSIRNRVRVD